MTMSRSGYTEDFDGTEWDIIRWRGAVSSAIRGQRGQQFLREMLDALDAMPQKRLIPMELEKGGEVCALGAVARARGLPVGGIDPEDYIAVANTFGISRALAQEIVYENDEGLWDHSTTPERRWQYMRNWVESHLKRQIEASSEAEK